MACKAHCLTPARPRATPWPDVPEARRAVMRAIKGKDTKPEMVVRRLVHGMGYRYRLHRKDLPGRPDLVFGPRKKVVFVHGCFWHVHEGCRLARPPKSRTEYWGPKLARNQERDRRDIAALCRAGWSVAVVWECHISRQDHLRQWLAQFLDDPAPTTTHTPA